MNAILAFIFIWTIWQWSWIGLHFMLDDLHDMNITTKKQFFIHLIPLYPAITKFLNVFNKLDWLWWKSLDKIQNGYVSLTPTLNLLYNSNRPYSLINGDLSLLVPSYLNLPNIKNSLELTLLWNYMKHASHLANLKLNKDCKMIALTTALFLAMITILTLLFNIVKTSTE